MGNFEEQLWTELTHAHGDELAGATRAPARRGRGRPIALTAGAFGLAGIVTAVSLALATTGAPAYAVTKHDDGTISIAIHDLAGVAGANADLAKLGVPVHAVTVDPKCRHRFYLVPMTSKLDVLLAVQHGKDEVAVRPAQIPHGDVLVVTAQQSGSSVLVLGVVGRGPVPSCVGNPGNLPGKSDLGSPPSR